MSKKEQVVYQETDTELAAWMDAQEVKSRSIAKVLSDYAREHGPHDVFSHEAWLADREAREAALDREREAVARGVAEGVARVLMGGAAPAPASGTVEPVAPVAREPEPVEPEPVPAAPQAPQQERAGSVGQAMGGHMSLKDMFNSQ